MRIVVQRVTGASVTAAGEVTGAISHGLVALVAFSRDDAGSGIPAMVEKLLRLRIFDDAEGRMNLSVVDTGGEVLCISQFTLYGDVRRGNRPSYEASAPREIAEPLFYAFCDEVRRHGVRCATGRFEAEMHVT
ncbi:MAG TPA: D-aminoacyl-tRNA deacylase, partial [Tepidiformaceae bacterium]|nr:D-aminoacyl-tRNA deacylase [Tepidiformaceae bacterium]